MAKTADRSVLVSSAGVRQDQRIVVGVHDPRFGSHPLGHLVGVVRGRQPGTDVQELADAGQIPDRPARKGPVRPGLCHDTRQHRGYPVTRLPVDGEVVIAAQPVVPDPSRMRNRRVPCSRSLACYLVDLICMVCEVSSVGQLTLAHVPMSA